MSVSLGPWGLLLNAVVTAGIFCVTQQSCQLSGSEFKVSGAPTSASSVVWACASGSSNILQDHSLTD